MVRKLNQSFQFVLLKSLKVLGRLYVEILTYDLLNLIYLLESQLFLFVFRKQRATSSPFERAYAFLGGEKSFEQQTSVSSSRNLLFSSIHKIHAIKPQIC